MLSIRYSFCALVIVFLAGCTGSRQAAMEQEMIHPLVGTWDYTIDSPQGVYTGMLTFEENEDNMLTGSLAASETPQLNSPMEKLVFDAETTTLSFSFDSGEYGIMNVTLTVAEDALDGVMNVVSFGMDVPMAASRQMDTK